MNKVYLASNNKVKNEEFDEDEIYLNCSYLKEIESASTTNPKAITNAKKRNDLSQSSPTADSNKKSNLPFYSNNSINNATTGKAINQNKENRTNLIVNNSITSKIINDKIKTGAGINVINIFNL
jgi:hypothetical protein